MSKLMQSVQRLVSVSLRFTSRLIQQVPRLVRGLLWPVTWGVGQAMRPVRWTGRVTVSQFPNVLAASIAVVSFAFISASFGSSSADADVVGVQQAVPTVILEPVLVSSDQAGESVESGVVAAGDQSESSAGGPSSRIGLLMHVLMLEKAEAVLSALPGYTATFSKQEVVAGELSDEQVMEIKIRHEPFSVYMKWSTGHKGRQLLYVTGENKGRMLVKLGGWKRRLPALKLDPSGSMAMKESRYPITKAGLLELVRESLAIRRGDLAKTAGVRCQLIENHEFDGRPCYAFVVEYKDRSASQRYRKSVMLIDRELGVPVVVRNFGWLVEGSTEKPTDESTLVEFYTYRDIRFQSEVAGGDFDRGNKSYRF